MTPPKVPSVLKAPSVLVLPPPVSVGSIVLYIDDGPVETAAIVTRVLNPTVVNLRTFRDDNENHFHARIGVAQGDNPGCWKWPVRV